MNSPFNHLKTLNSPINHLKPVNSPFNHLKTVKSPFNHLKTANSPFNHITWGIEDSKETRSPTKIQGNIKMDIVWFLIL